MLHRSSLAILLLALFSSVIGAPFDLADDERIVNGTQVQIAVRPYQIALTISIPGGYVDICGGSIIAPSWIVTAGHCTYDKSASNMTVRAGSNKWDIGGTTRSVYAKYVPTTFSIDTMVDDISVLWLKSPLTYSSTIAEIALATSVPAAGTNVIVSGYGTTSSGGNLSTYLEDVVVQIVNKTLCQNNYSNSLSPSMFCAAAPGKDSCQGDSGGPITTSTSPAKLIGVVSWGNGCALAGYPGIYTSIKYLRDWVITTCKNCTT